MRRNKRGRRRQLARPFAYGRGHLLGKQAGAVAEALRRRGVTAHVNPSWSGRSLLVQVADPAAHMGYLDAHADALADALLADSVSISSGLHDFIVAPEWRGLDDSAETEDEAAGPPTGSAERSPSEPPTPEVASPGVSAVATLEAFIHGYKMGRLAGVLGDLRHYLVLGGPRDDGGFELRLPAGCNGDAVRAQLRDWSAAIAEALGADTCRIGGRGRRITITPVLLPLSVAAQAA
jgi:hypothetical protein